MCDPGIRECMGKVLGAYAQIRGKIMMCDFFFNVQNYSDYEISIKIIVNKTAIYQLNLLLKCEWTWWNKINGIE